MEQIMNKSKFHLSEDGIARKCVAEKEPCKLSHYATKDQAAKAYENKMQESTFNKQQKKEIIITKESVQSAIMSANYGHYSIVKNHLHNSINTGNEAELYYYSTAQGRLELNRRIAQNPRREELHEIYAKINDVKFKPTNITEQLDTQQIKESIEQGYENFHKQRGESDYLLIASSDNKSLNEKKAKHALADMSEKWNKRLSIEEQEAVSFATSNGFSTIQYAAGYKEIHDVRISLQKISKADELESTLNPNNWEENDEIIEQHMKDHANKYLTDYKNALNKAPTLSEPIMTYRGTTQNELKDILGVSKTANNNEVIENLKKGNYDGIMASSKSRLQTIPESATTHAGKSRSFGNNIVLEIAQKSGSSPTNISAWGANEHEMLTNPNSKYKIHGSRTLYDKRGEEIIILEIEEIRTKK